MSLRRKPPRRDPLPRILVVTEGLTEADYINRLRVELAAGVVDIKVLAEGGVPKTVVEIAVDEFRRSRREAKRRRDWSISYTEAWCLFDVDEHPRVDEARQQARDNGLLLAVSNPCFELWLLVHFEDQRASVDRGRVQAATRGYLTNFDKRLEAANRSLLFQRLPDAERRAEATDAWHITRGTTGGNPSTQVYLLTRKIASLGRDNRLNP